MGALFKHTGTNIDHTPGGALSAGDVVVVGDRALVATTDIAAGELGSLATEGVFQFPKAAGDGGIAVGVGAYWDAADGVIQDDADSGTNKQAGWTVAAAATADTTVLVKLGR